MESSVTVDVKSEEAHKEKTKLSARELFRQFTESTTLHGISHVFSNGSKTRRLIWLICLLASTATFVAVTKKLFSSYMSFDVVTRVTLINKDFQIFPAVTICNFNPFRKDFVERMNLTEALALIQNEDGDKNTESLHKAASVLNTSMEVVLREGGHKMDMKNMLKSCIFQGKQCGEEHFKPVFTRMGLCYTFNRDSVDSFARIQNPGEDSGLTLGLDIQQDQYFGLLSTIAGFKIHIHGQNEPPLIKENGFAVMPGACTFVAVTKTKVKSLTAPYKTKCENKKLPGTTIYSKPLCYEACRASYIINKCGCRDAEMPKILNIPICTFQQKGACVLPQDDEFTRSTVKNCSCPKPCEVTLYNTRLSYAQYPSEHAKESLSKYYAKIIFGKNSSAELAQYVNEYIGKNTVQVRIFLQDLNYHVIEDVAKYQLANLCAEAGGMLGLLLGASIITVVEFLDFLFSLFAIKYFK